MGGFYRSRPLYNPSAVQTPDLTFKEIIMRKLVGPIAILAISLLSALPAVAQDKAMEKKEEKPAVAGVRGDVLRQIADAEKKLVALAEATPAEKFAWRPGTGVRSTGEVFAHTAAANFFLPTFFGGKLPDGLDPRTLEKDGADKAKMMDALKKSFEHIRQAVTAASDADLEKATTVFGRQTTYRGVMLGAATHAHEHLGQSIAYARMNGIVPPWSQSE